MVDNIISNESGGKKRSSKIIQVPVQVHKSKNKGIKEKYKPHTQVVSWSKGNLNSDLAYSTL